MKLVGLTLVSLFQDCIREVMDLIEVHMRASLPPSPVPSPTLPDGDLKEAEQQEEAKAQVQQEKQDENDGDEKTPTKVLEVGSRL